MREIYNEQYYRSGCGPIPYEEPEHWVKFFGTIADHIVSDLNPTVVLDAGCAMGYLVAALRDRGVEAYGVDISEYAISKVREDIKPYCTVGSLIDNLPDSLPRHYDLVITIEVLEHLNADDGKRAIANLCTLSDTILFTSTPSDFTEPTHINVQQREYWAKLFAEHGFYDDLGYRPLFVSRHAIFYQKMSLLEMVDKTAKAVSLMDERFWRQEADLVKQVDQVKTQIKKVRERDRKLLEQGAAIQKLNADLAQQIEKVRERD